ncbi:twin-arginine translocase subunit TatC [Haloferax sp. YSSS75]|uniref:twin-arginine translocase subunit TatC n=1 Tax=Haloferax sp. YSSS75 TaxID=3388564 RepID=UPI00398CB241
MADEERDVESSTDDETNVSDDVTDNDPVSRGDDSDTGDDVVTDGSDDVATDDSTDDETSTDESDASPHADDSGDAPENEESDDDASVGDSDDDAGGEADASDTSEDDADSDTSEDDADSDTSEDDADSDTSEDDADSDTSEDDADSDTSEDETEPVYGRVTPRDEATPDESTDDDESGTDPGEDTDGSDTDGDDEVDADDADDGDDADAEDDGDDADDAEDDVTVGPTGDAPDPYDPSTAMGDDDDGLVGSAPESDQEMPLTDHIEEMIRRLAVVFGVAGLITLILFPGADILNAYVNTGLPSATDVINFLWNTHIPAADSIADRRPRLYGPLELILTKLKVAGLAGTVIGLPVFVYETYLFMRPGLYPKERKYYLAAVPTSLILAVIGVIFAHFVVLPAIFAYFTSYTEGTAVIAFGLKETFNLILILMGYMAIVFQIPLFVELAIMMNLVTRLWLEDRRLLFWGAFLGLAFLVSPDPTGMAPIIIAATMITLFEGTLAVLRWTGN